MTATGAVALREPEVASRVGAARLRSAWVLVGAAVGWNLLHLRAQTIGVAYLNDSSVHEQMVRFASSQLQLGHLPLTSWFPFLGLGSPQFLHYPSLPAMLTGLVGLGVGPDTAFRWSLYILMSLFPVSVYLGSRLFGAERWSAASSAAMSPFLMSVVGVGYEQGGYVWTGYGVWAQLWASLMLPLAWGFSWRALRDGRNFLPAVALVSFTTALHFETGYLAMLPLVLWPLVSKGQLTAHIRRSVVLVGGSLLATSWVIVPLIAQRSWAATNEILSPTPLVNGYGAGRVLSWLASGQLLDFGRLPVITLFAAGGLVIASIRSRSDLNARAMLMLLAGCILLSFGRTTLGTLVQVIPGSSDIFFRRFMMGVQLVALLLAGIGAAGVARAIWNALDRWAKRASAAWPTQVTSHGLAPAAVAIGATVICLTPAWIQLGTLARHNAAAISKQHSAETHQSAAIDRLIAVIKRDGGGRVYAGMPSNWGAKFTVGVVPVFKYLESQDLDEVGYTLRTASLMTDPEYFFDERNPGDYRLFTVHYLILPASRRPPIQAQLVLRDGSYYLWRTNTSGYVHIGRIVGTLSANRTNVGVRSIPLLHSQLTQRGAYLRVAFGQKDIAPPPLPSPSIVPTPGNVLAESDDLELGRVSAVVRMRSPGVAVLSAAFDPGWRLSVDGAPQRAFVAAPALVATAVPAGTHRVVYTYAGFQDYPSLFALSGLTLVALLVTDVLHHRRRRLHLARDASVTETEPPRSTFE